MIPAGALHRMDVSGGEQVRVHTRAQEPLVVRCQAEPGTIEKVEKWETQTLTIETTSRTSSRSGGGVLMGGYGFMGGSAHNTSHSSVANLDSTRHTRLYLCSASGRTGEADLPGIDAAAIEGGDVTTCWYVAGDHRPVLAGLLDHRTRIWYLSMPPDRYLTDVVGVRPVSLLTYWVVPIPLAAGSYIAYQYHPTAGYYFVGVTLLLYAIGLLKDVVPVLKAKDRYTSNRHFSWSCRQLEQAVMKVIGSTTA